MPEKPEKTFIAGDRVSVTFSATVVGADSEGRLLAQLDRSNGGYNFLIPPGAEVKPEQPGLEQAIQVLTDAIIELSYPEIVAKHLPAASRKVIENTARIHLKRAWNLGKGG